MGFSLGLNIKIRPAKLDDSQELSDLQEKHMKDLNILDMPKSAEKIRLSIGSGMLKQNNYFVVEEESTIIGFIEHKKTNDSHIMLGYPYVELSHPRRREVQEQLLNETIEKMKGYGYQYVSTQVSRNMYEGEQLYQDLGFENPTPILQTFHGPIDPDPEIDLDDYTLKRVSIDHLDITYSWIKRQLNPLSPIYITKKHYAKMLRAPKKVRDGWSIVFDDDVPVAFISSIKDKNTGEIVIFGPFNDEDRIDVRIPLLNELMLYHRMKGNDSMRLMRIQKFDNDDELIDFFNLSKGEEIKILTKKI